MINRTEALLALSLPAIAVGWVIVDAATGLVAADRQVQAPLPAVQIVRTVDTAVPAAPNTQKSNTVLCSRGNSQTQIHGLSQATVQRLCQAGLKFTSDLPKS